MNKQVHLFQNSGLQENIFWFLLKQQYLELVESFGQINPDWTNGIKIKKKVNHKIVREHRTTVSTCVFTCLHLTCTDASECLDNHPLVLKGAGGSLQDGQEDLPKEHL